MTGGNNFVSEKNVKLQLYWNMEYFTKPKRDKPYYNSAYIFWIYI